jgi:hypothetical protein
MWWMAIAKAGMAVAKAVAGNRTAKAAEALGEAKAKYENAIRGEKNKIEGAETALANVAQSIGNRRRLDAAGANLGRAGEALARQQEAATANRFSRRVQAAEQAGAAVAGAAFAGVTGGNVNTLIETATLRQSMVEEVSDRQQEQNEYELRKNAGEQVAAGIAGLDQRLIRPNLDVGVSVNQAPKAGSLLEALTHPEMVNDLANAGKAAYGQFATKAPALQDSTQIPMQPGGGY